METVSLFFLVILLLVIILYFLYTEYGLDPLPTTWGPVNWSYWRNRWWGPSDVVLYDVDPYGRGHDRQTKWYEWRKMAESIEELARSNREIAAKMNQPAPPPPPPPPSPSPSPPSE